jgi:titin
VTVTDRPKPPEKIAIKIQLDRTVTLSWSPPEDDGGCKIGTYIVEYFRIGWDVWLKAATSRQLAITLNDLIAGSQYKFRVKAENPYGVSDPSEESEVVFVPDPSRGITRDSLNIANAGIEAKKSPISIRSEKIPPKKPSPLPEIRLNTNIFDDETINRDMAYGTASNFSREAPVSLKEKSQFGIQNQKLKTVKNNVKFKLDSDASEENIQTQTSTTTQKSEQNESKMTSKKTLLDLSKTCDNNVPSSVQNSTEFMLVLYDKESNNSTSKFSYPLILNSVFPSKLLFCLYFTIQIEIS